MPRAQDLIETAYQRFISELPALDKLKLVVRLELRGRGDVQVFRVRLPGRRSRRASPRTRASRSSLSRRTSTSSHEGTLEHWHKAYEHGDIKVGGDPQVIKLVGTVIERHEARARLRKAH